MLAIYNSLNDNKGKKAKYFHEIHDLIKHFSQKSWFRGRRPAQVLKLKKLTRPIFFDGIPLALNRNGMP